MTLDDGVNVGLWSERGVGKSPGLEEGGCAHVEACYLWGHAYGVLGAFSSPGSEERNPAGLDSGS